MGSISTEIPKGVLPVDHKKILNSDDILDLNYIP